MDRPSHPHVVRTWAVDRIRVQAPTQAHVRPQAEKSKARRQAPDSTRKKT